MLDAARARYRCVGSPDWLTAWRPTRCAMTALVATCAARAQRIGTRARIACSSCASNGAGKDGNGPSSASVT